MRMTYIIGLILKKLKGSLKVAKEQGMIVGEGVTVMGGVNFGSEPYLITLERDVRISSDVIFVTHDGGIHAFRDQEKYKKVVKYGKIVVGERSFIGAKSIIMPGVIIGKRCVIGAGSVVTKDVPDYTVVCGNPAKPICTVWEYAEKCLKGMPEDFDHDALLKDKKDYLTSIIK